MAQVLGDYFCGRTARREYNQHVAAIHYRNEVTSTDQQGNVTVVSSEDGYNVYTAAVEEETYRFEGVPTSLAMTTGNVSVLDIGEMSPLQLSLTPTIVMDGDSNLSYEKKFVEVMRSRMSPHMWTIEVTRRRAALYKNGTKIVDAPSW